jgi:predicted DNA binding CopG/RHH family protein
MLGQDSGLSAFCSTQGTNRVNGAALPPWRPTITVRLTISEKERFGLLASTHGISESTLALIAIRDLLNSNTPASSAEPAPREPASDRITIRLRPGDGQVIADRAAKRGIKASKYLAALVRGHVSRDPPLTTDELVALKTAISVLSKIGMILGTILRSITTATPDSEMLIQEMRRTQFAVADVEQRVHDLTRVALISWESRYD